MSLSIFKGCSRVLCLDSDGYDGDFTRGEIYTVTNVYDDRWLELIDNNGDLTMVPDIHACNDFSPIDDGNGAGLDIYFQLKEIVNGNYNYVQA